MKYGLLLTSVWNKDDEPAVQLHKHEELVRRADELGFNTVVAGQHFLGHELRYYQPVPWLVHMSSLSATMRFATGIVLLPMVNPVEIAEQMSTLDVITGGRAVFGVALGYSPQEFAAFGIARGTKVARFEESLDLIKRLWSGESVTFKGTYWSVENARPSVLPVQQGGVPVWIGGQARGAVARAARLADAWYAPPFPAHSELRELRKLYLDTAEATGHTVSGEFPLRRELLIAPSREAAFAAAVDRFEARYEVYRKWGLSGENTPLASGGDLRDQIEGHFILGTPQQCAAELAELADTCGMTEFVYKSHWPGLPHEQAMEQLELFGAEVMPLLK